LGIQLRIAGFECSGSAPGDVTRIAAPLSIQRFRGSDPAMIPPLPQINRQPPMQLAGRGVHPARGACHAGRGYDAHGRAGVGDHALKKVVPAISRHAGRLP
jgi:hypothetical protein